MGLLSHEALYRYIYIYMPYIGVGITENQMQKNMENGTEATIQGLRLRGYNPNDGESNGKEHGE